MYKWEGQLLDGFAKRINTIILAIITVAAILIRLQGMEYVSDDYRLFIEPWFEQLKAAGGLAGLAQPIGDYNIPYLLIMAVLTHLPFPPLFMIKAVSVFFEFVCAITALKLTDMIVDRQSKWISATVYALVLFSPIVLLNGAFWGQCDYIYIAFILLSFYCYHKAHYNNTFIFLGIALAFKQQTLFILPLFILVYLLNRSFSFTRFLWLPIIYLGAGLPAVIAGRPWDDVYLIYVRQTGTYPSLSMNMPNIWRIFSKDQYQTFAVLGIWMVIIVLALMTACLMNKKYRLDGQGFLLMGTIISGLCVMILPAMHERYVALYCLLITIYFMIYERRKFYISLIPNFIALITYLHYLYDLDLVGYYTILAVVNGTVLLYMIVYAFNKIFIKVTADGGSL
jgi:Gpi18-like mannosyltransferase